MSVVALQKAVALFRTQGNGQVDMCLSKIDLLLTIATQPGRSPAAYAELCGLPASTTNRHIRELRAGHVGPQRGKPGLGLVTSQSNPSDWRQHEVFLTRKGELLVEHLQSLLNR